MPYSTYKSYLAQTTTVRVVKTVPGALNGYVIYNPNAVVSYVQCFDTADAVTLGTTVPSFVIPMPATAGANVLTDQGITLTKGLAIACTTTATGSTAPSTGLDILLAVQ